MKNYLRILQVVLPGTGFVENVLQGVNQNTRLDPDLNLELGQLRVARAAVHNARARNGDVAVLSSPD